MRNMKIITGDGFSAVNAAASGTHGLKGANAVGATGGEDLCGNGRPGGNAKPASSCGGSEFLCDLPPYQGIDGAHNSTGGKPGMRTSIFDNTSYWVENPGANGGDGAGGTGGVGGVDCCYQVFLPTTLSAGGGGGPGCGGKGGTGGLPGGSSIGIQALQSKGIILENISINTGVGGDGQEGGEGGNGGDGGDGGDGERSNLKGGNGGDGSGGAGGGGGAGGHSICVVHDKETGGEYYRDTTCKNESAGKGGKGGIGGAPVNNTHPIAKGGDGANGSDGILSDTLCRDCNHDDSMPPTSMFSCNLLSDGLHTLNYRHESSNRPIEVYCSNGWARVLRNKGSETQNLYNKSWEDITTEIVDDKENADDMMMNVSLWSKFGNRMKLVAGSHFATMDFVLNPESEYRMWTGDLSILSGGTTPGFYNRTSVYGPLLSTEDRDNDYNEIPDFSCGKTYPMPWWYGGRPNICWSGSFWGNAHGDESYDNLPYWGNTHDSQDEGSIWVRWE